MKRAILFLLMVSVCMYISAQDVIIKKGGQVINCRIISADSSKVIVKYNIDGYIVDGSIKREEVNEMLFNYKSSEAPAAVKKVSVNNKEIPFRQETRYYLSAGTAFAVLKGDARYYGEVALSEDMKMYPRLFPLDISFGFEQSLNQSLSFSGGLEYSQKGIAYYVSSSTGDQRVWYSIKLDYFELPVCMKIMPASWVKTANSGYFAKVGIAPAYRATAKIKLKAVNGTDKAEEVQDMDGTGDYDINLLMGLGYKFSDRYAVEMIFEQGSLNVIEKDYAPLTLYNRSLMFNFVIRF